MTNTTAIRISEWPKGCLTNDLLISSAMWKLTVFSNWSNTLGYKHTKKTHAAQRTRRSSQTFHSKGKGYFKIQERNEISLHATSQGCSYVQCNQGKKAVQGHSRGLRRGREHLPISCHPLDAGSSLHLRSDGLSFIPKQWSWETAHFKNVKF